MKSIIYLSIFILFLSYSIGGTACDLDFYVDKTALKPVVFSAISTDNKYQYTSIPVSPGEDTGFSLIACTTYNIYAQYVDSDTTVNSYGDYAYIANPLQLNGNISIFFPSRFKTNSINLKFPNQFKKSNEPKIAE